MRKASCVISRVALIVGVGLRVACSVGYAQERVLFELLVEPDAKVSIKNVSDQTWTLEGYSLISVARALDEDGWYPIGQQFLDDPDRIVSLLGEEFLVENIPFGELFIPQQQQFLEFGGARMFWDPGLTISIGKPFGEDVDQIRALVESGGLEWAAHFFSDIGGGHEAIRFIPEPSGLALAGLACLGLLAAGRRRHRP